MTPRPSPGLRASSLVEGSEEAYGLPAAAPSGFVVTDSAMERENGLSDELAKDQHHAFREFDSILVLRLQDLETRLLKKLLEAQVTDRCEEIFENFWSMEAVDGTEEVVADIIDGIQAMPDPHRTPPGKHCGKPPSELPPSTLNISKPTKQESDIVVSLKDVENQNGQRVEEKSNTAKLSAVSDLSRASAANKKDRSSLYQFRHNIRLSARHSVSSANRTEENHHPVHLTSTLESSEQLVQSKSQKREEAERIHRLHVQTTVEFDTGKGPPTPVQRFVRSRSFDLFFVCLIVCNAVLTGIEVECKSVDVDMDLHIAFPIVNGCFAIAFVVEMSMRVAADGWRIFTVGSNAAWMWFDLVLVLVSLVEIVADLLLALGAIPQNYTTLRTFRMIKFAKLARSIKLARLVRFVNSLQGLIISISAAIKSLVWSFMLLFLIMYSFSLLFVQASSDYRADSDQHNIVWRGYPYWGHLSDAMMTLLQTVCGGLSWNEAMQPLKDVSEGYAYVLAMYVCFSYFCVLNGVTGAFCNSAMEAAMQNPDLMAENIMNRNRRYGQKLSELFQRLDADGSGRLTSGEFVDVLSDPHMSACLMAMDIDVDDAWTLFTLLDLDGNHEIQVNEFITGCIRLRGPAKSLDMVDLHGKVDTLQEILLKVSGRFEKQATRMKHLLKSGSNMSLPVQATHRRGPR